jgi:hypothetical protein
VTRGGVYEQPLNVEHGTRMSQLMGTLRWAWPEYLLDYVQGGSR